MLLQFFEEPVFNKNTITFYCYRRVHYIKLQNNHAIQYIRLREEC